MEFSSKKSIIINLILWEILYRIKDFYSDNSAVSSIYQTIVFHARILLNRKRSNLRRTKNSKQTIRIFVCHKKKQKNTTNVVIGADI